MHLFSHSTKLCFARNDESVLTLQDPSPPESNSITLHSSFNYPSPQPSTSFSYSFSCTLSDFEKSPISLSNKRKRTPVQSTPSITEKSLKKRRTVTANKSTRTKAFDADLVYQCNVCLSKEEKGQWVGCSPGEKSVNTGFMTVAWALTLKLRRWLSKCFLCVLNTWNKLIVYHKKCSCFQLYKILLIY